MVSVFRLHVADLLAFIACGRSIIGFAIFVVINLPSLAKSPNTLESTFLRYEGLIGLFVIKIKIALIVGALTVDQHVQLLIVCVWKPSTLLSKHRFDGQLHTTRQLGSPQHLRIFNLVLCEIS